MNIGTLSFFAAGPVHDRLCPMNDDGINPVLFKSQVVYVSAKQTMLFAKLAEDMMTCWTVLRLFWSEEGVLGGFQFEVHRDGCDMPME